MKKNKIWQNKRYLLQNLSLFFFVFISQVSFLSIYLSTFEVESLMIVKSTYFRFNLFFIFAVFFKYILQVNKKEFIQNKYFTTNYWLIVSVIYIVFNRLFPVEINWFGNILLLILFIATINGFALSNSLQNFIIQIQFNYYKTIFIGLGVLIFMFEFNLIFLNLLIQICLIFRKQINFIIFNFKKTQFIKKIKYFKGDFL
ncbi:hypothetical protein [Spiroplasma culicicola]|uniref:Uncharacterized protein n=1 Tax=Spiroplasma culicicola AES-1 TaxID=1276246 RepID=W6A746_9MOLU|nr:hypothetical protein [Spiroplasma culicicola]AHI52963.1 hypothetical protein SCULI_v1c06220 [Spiroplasma culicicola AES-1]